MGEGSPRDTRTRILEAATELFSRHGMRKTSIQDIADKSGLAKGALYYYFESKEAVFAAVLQSDMDRMWEQIQAAVESAPTPSEKFTAHFMTAMRAFGESPIASQAIHDEISEHFEMAARIRLDGRRREIEGVRQILTEGVASGAFRPMNCDRIAEILVSAFEGVMCSPSGIRNALLDDQEQPGEMLHLLLNGIRSTPDAPPADTSLMSFLIAFIGA